jgi:branched-subunit amino acid transport protein
MSGTMSWSLVIWLSAGAYLLKVLGFVVIGGRRLPAVLERCLVLIPAALLSALVIKDTFSVGNAVVVDERLAGLVVAAGLAWRRMPLLVVVVGAAAVTAVLRLA